jgi:hypothetical protein
MDFSGRLLDSTNRHRHQANAHYAQEDQHQNTSTMSGHGAVSLPRRDIQAQQMAALDTH